MSKFTVMDRKCDQCLYSPDKIVSDARRKEILRELNRQDTHFICHKASALGEQVACAGDMEARGCGQLGRIMGRLGGIERVSTQEYERRFADIGKGSADA